MQQDDEFSGHAKPELYPLFHEAVSLPAVKEWIGWDEQNASFTKPEQLQQFYTLISPQEPEEGVNRDPKITTYGEVRELRNILGNTEARAVLLDPNKSFLDAITIARRQDLSNSWLSSVAGAIDALNHISVVELIGSSEQDRAEIVKLRDLASALLENYEKLKQ
jgi:hypothetical protein